MKSWVFITALCLSPASALAQTAQGFTLRDALTAMTASHPALLTAESDVRAARGDAVAAGLWTNPTVSAAWTPGVRNSSYDRTGYVSLAVTQFVELSGVPAARRQSAEALAMAARMTRENVLLGLSLDLESAMVHLVAHQRRLAVAEETLARLTEVSRVVDERVAAGAAPRYDATRIHNALALAHADADTARADVLRARGDLAVAVGPGIATLQGEAALALDEAYPLGTLASLESALVERPDLRAALQRASAADASIAVARRSVFPGVGVQLSTGYGQSPGQVDVGVGVTLPLPVVDRGQGSIAAAQGRASSARASAEGLRTLETLRLRGAFAEAQQRREAVTTFRDATAVTSAQGLDEARAGYVNGRFSVLELADAYTSWRDSRQREVDLLEAARQSEINVARIAGLQRPR